MQATKRKATKKTTEYDKNREQIENTQGSGNRCSKRRVKNKNLYLNEQG